MSSLHLTEGLHVEEGLPQKGVIIPELEVRENARWMALLIDTEGAIGWTLATQRLGRMNEEYRYVYRYAIPYVAIGMSEVESKRTVDEAARLIGTRVRTRRMRLNFPPVREITETRGRALAVITLTKPYLDKFSRMATLIATLFNHRKYRTHNSQGVRRINNQPIRKTSNTRRSKPNNAQNDRDRIHQTDKQSQKTHLGSLLKAFDHEKVG